MKTKFSCRAGHGLDLGDLAAQYLLCGHKFIGSPESGVFGHKINVSGHRETADTYVAPFIPGVLWYDSAAPMRIYAIILAFVALAVGKVLSWYCTRDWKSLTVNPETTFFPTICPLCLSQATESVTEKSPPKQTANYIVASRNEYWSGSVPYCSKCINKVHSGQGIGILFGAACAVIAFVLMPPDNPYPAGLVYILFGYPAYVIATLSRKGVVFESGGKTHLTLSIRRPEYFEAWKNANQQAQAKAEAVPLAGGKGVWRR
ncbi:MAG TPA: hypothetical protein VGQ12_17260 [Candidatus Angelobacter sp.]|nr:hypothetical protein [Candidatus Angelobacter sp.]